MEIPNAAPDLRSAWHMEPLISRSRGSIQPTRRLSIAIQVSLYTIAAFLSACSQSPTSDSKKPPANKLFAGETIEFVIPYKEGGGSDTWARFNAAFLSRHLPGNPVVVVRNIPGGGSIKGANLYAQRAKPNGLMILGTSGSTQMPYLLDDPRVRYDYADWQVIAAYPTGGVVYCSPSLGVSKIEDLKKELPKRLIFASQGPTSLDIVPMLAFDLLGLDVKTVFGFRGRSAGRLAFERGEVPIDYQTSAGYLKNVVPLVREGSAIPLWSWGVLDAAGTLTRDPSFPDLPHFGEVYQSLLGKETQGIAWESWLALMAAGFGGMKLLVTPIETPEPILQAYRDAFLAMREDPEYIERKEKAIGRYKQEVGTKAESIFKLATRISADEKRWVKAWLRDRYDLNIQ